MFHPCETRRPALIAGGAASLLCALSSSHSTPCGASPGIDDSKSIVSVIPHESSSSGGKMSDDASQPVQTARQRCNPRKVEFPNSFARPQGLPDSSFGERQHPSAVLLGSSGGSLAEMDFSRNTDSVTTGLKSACDSFTMQTGRTAGSIRDSSYDTVQPANSARVDARLWIPP